jgi:hypothetical protein
MRRVALMLTAGWQHCSCVSVIYVQTLSVYTLHRVDDEFIWIWNIGGMIIERGKRKVLWGETSTPVPAANFNTPLGPIQLLVYSMPRLRTFGATPPLLHISQWRAQGLCLYFTPADGRSNRHSETNRRKFVTFCARANKGGGGGMIILRQTNRKTFQRFVQSNKWKGLKSN